MSSDSIHHVQTQRRVVRILLTITAVLLAIGIPLMLFDDLRYNIAQQLELIPGKGAEQLADGDDGATLIVVPLGEYSGVGREQYAYRADYIARPASEGVQLTDIESDETIDLPLESIDFVSNDPDGDHILFRGPGVDTGDTLAVVLDTDENAIDVLPDGQLTPELPGAWDVETWEKVTGTCDRFSPQSRFVACFNRADAASYLAGDWQIDIQLYGDFEVVEPLYRGMGFLLPSVGFAHDDTWLYLQNEEGIYRIEIPESMQDRSVVAHGTPEGSEGTP